MPMKICVFGADGRTGVEVVRYAVSRGADVVAFAYGSGSDKFFPDGVTVRHGDVMQMSAVVDALDGCDAVISALGHIKGSDPLMQTKGIANIVKAMEQKGIKRIVSLTGTGARADGDTPSLIDILLNVMVRFVDPDRVSDGVEHVNVLKASSLAWTVVRVLKLGKGEAPAAKYRLTDGGPAELQTDRKKVAAVLVDQVLDETMKGQFIRKLPVVSG